MTTSSSKTSSTEAVESALDVPDAPRSTSTASAAAVLPPEEWVDAYGDFLFRYAVARLHDSHAAEEVVQETFLAGIRYLQQYSGRGSQRGWLLRILQRKIIDFIRARSRRPEEPWQHAQEDSTALVFDENGGWKEGVLPQIVPGEQLKMRELWQVVRVCLKSIPPGQADVFVLSVMEDMRTHQICDVLGISKENLWVRLHRARVGLAKCVSAKWHLSEQGSPT